MFDSLPVIIVTGKTKTAADEIISEIIDNDATAEVKPSDDESPDRVWRLVNKYYSADVRVRVRADSDAAMAGPGAGAEVGAHVVLLARDELQEGAAVAVAARRLAGVPPAAVQVVACDAAAVPASVAELCARRRLEPCALREPTSARAEPFSRARGVAAVRAALHAHVWPGLRRRPREEPQETRFLRALGALGGAAELTATLEGAERRAAAERLVAEFAAALGHPLDEFDFEDAM